MLALQEKKEVLQVKIADIDSELASLMNAAQGSAPAKTPAKRGRPAKKVAAKKPAAKKAKRGRKPTAKKPAVKVAAQAKAKLGPGRPKKVAVKAAPAAKGKNKAKAGAKRGRKRGQTGEKILKALAAAGKSGTSVKELAVSTKIKPQNLYVWFNSTGRKVTGLKKVGKARYALNA